MTDNRGREISVCLLTYNHVDVVESTLRSILDQTVSGYEVIVSDDSSSDGTWERILTLAREDDRIKPVRTPRNMGMAANANFAVRHAARPYVALLHHDDLYRQDLLDQWLGVMERHADVGFVFNQYGFYQSSLVKAHPFVDERLDGRWFLVNHLLAHWGCPVRGVAMIRRAWWLKVDGMREHFGLLADVDLWMRLAAATAVGYVAEPLVTVRHARPAYYPDIYKSFSWRTQRYLYEIHAANHQAYWDVGTLAGRLRWWRFRFRLSRETGRWLAYAVVRRKRSMIATSGDGATPYDLYPLRLLRVTLRALARL